MERLVSWWAGNSDRSLRQFAIVLTNVGGLPRCTESILSINEPRFQDADHIRKLRSPLARLVPYQEGADPWQNTILIGPYPVELLALPAGVGVSFYVKAKDVTLPIKSRYVLAKPETVKKQNWALKEIVRFHGLHDSIGYQAPPFSANLYLNLAFASPPHRP